MEQSVEIVYKDSDLLVLNKPAGWVTTRENQKSKIKGQKYIEDWVEENYPNDLPRKGIVHRLDKGTSGLLVVARNEKSLAYLKKQFKDKLVEKKYLALVVGDLPGDGVMDVPIGRLSGRGKFGVVVGGREARTEFKVVAKYRGLLGLITLLELSPKTGRTHQIRVHLKYLGWPIVGDRKYGGLAVAGLNRPFLHAASLKINHPQNGELMKFEVELAVELKTFLATYEKV